MALGLWPWLVAAWSPRSSAVDAKQADLSIASFNLHIDNPYPAGEIAAVKNCQADVLVLLEVDAEDEQSLREDPRWPYQRWLPRGGGSWSGNGMAVLSRLRVDAFLIRDTAGFPVIEAQFTKSSKPLSIFAVHPQAPLDPEGWRLRDQQLGLIAEAVRDEPGPFLVIGDFNLSPADPAWRRLLQASALYRPPGCAAATWPRVFGPFGIAIDHILAGNGAKVGRLYTYDIPGSDHSGIAAHISIR
jgi:endonuclease/exonuclease/phosphatase (EEP) superfamily protein YafD